MRGFFRGGLLLCSTGIINCLFRLKIAYNVVTMYHYGDPQLPAKFFNQLMIFKSAEYIVSYPLHFLRVVNMLNVRSEADGNRKFGSTL